MAQRVTRACKNPACQKTFESRTVRSLYCCKQCNTEYHRRNRSKTVTIGRLSVTFEDCNPELTLDQLEAIVRQELTPELIELIHSDKPIQLGESHA